MPTVPTLDQLLDTYPGVEITSHGSQGLVWLDWLYVPPALRGKGIGKKVYKAWERELPRNVDMIKLFAADSEGEGNSDRFWDSLGFDYSYDGDEDDLDYEAQHTMQKFIKRRRTALYRHALLQPAVTTAKEAQRYCRRTVADQTYTYLSGYLRRHPDMQNFLDLIPVHYGQQGTGPEAEQKLVNGVPAVVLYDKFFALDQDGRDYVITHEIGHWVSGQLTKPHWFKLAEDFGIDVRDTPNLPWANFNSEEAFADTFAVVLLDPTEHRQPKWRAMLTAIIEEFAGHDFHEVIHNYEL